MRHGWEWEIMFRCRVKHTSLSLVLSRKNMHTTEKGAKNFSIYHLKLEKNFPSRVSSSLSVSDETQLSFVFLLLLLLQRDLSSTFSHLFSREKKSFPFVLFSSYLKLESGSWRWCWCLGEHQNRRLKERKVVWATVLKLFLSHIKTESSLCSLYKCVLAGMRVERHLQAFHDTRRRYRAYQPSLCWRTTTTSLFVEINEWAIHLVRKPWTYCFSNSMKV